MIVCRVPCHDLLVASKCESCRVHNGFYEREAAKQETAKAKAQDREDREDRAETEDREKREQANRERDATGDRV